MAFGSVGLSTHIWNNNARSVLLLSLYPLILMGVVWAVCFVFGVMMGADGQADPVGMGAAIGNDVLARYWPLILSAVAIWFLIAWSFHGRMIRAMAHSHPVTRQQEPELYNLMENLCIARGVPMPRLEIIETHARNAFASGIDKRSYTVTVTRGLLNALQKDEVEAVLAHELAHILNRDVRLLIVSIIFTGMLGLAAQMVWNTIRFSFYGGGRRRDGRIVLVMVAIVAVLGVGYAASVLTRYAISRRREYLADAGAVEVTKNPQAMMRALQRISRHDRIPQATPDVAMMCTENSKAFLGVFATHPPIGKRIAMISAMTNTPVPEMPSGVSASHTARFGGSATTQNPWLSRTRHRR